MFLYRKDYENKETGSAVSPRAGSRNRATDRPDLVELTFLPEFTRFKNRAGLSEEGEREAEPGWREKKLDEARRTVSWS